MSTQDKITPHAGDGDDGHNHSAQQNVTTNPDPVLALSNEHHHAHLHHGATAHPPEKDDVMFATSTTTDKYTNTGASDYKVRQTSSRDDEESGGVGDIIRDDEGEQPAHTRKWTARRVYTEYRAYIHFLIWSVWTA